jgi:peptidoglycan/LPS O-acetylase OafA/YrhL
MSMTATSITPTTTTAESPTTHKPASLRRATVTVGAVAAVVTAAAAAALHAAGVSFEIDGEMIPIAGFAQLTFISAVIGGVLVAVFNRKSSAPHHRFMQVAVALTALSCVPSVAMPPEASTKLSLVALHLLAAAIIVPVLARHAND